MTHIGNTIVEVGETTLCADEIWKQMVKYQGISSCLKSLINYVVIYLISNPIGVTNSFTRWIIYECMDKNIFFFLSATSSLEVGSQLIATLSIHGNPE